MTRRQRRASHHWALTDEANIGQHSKAVNPQILAPAKIKRTRSTKGTKCTRSIKSTKGMEGIRSMRSEKLEAKSYKSTAKRNFKFKRVYISIQTKLNFDL